MLHVVTGGSGSGKSEYAEKLIAESALHRRIYVATMMVWDDEGRKRVRRHREMRSGKGFITIEHYTGLSSSNYPPVISSPLAISCPSAKKWLWPPQCGRALPQGRENIPRFFLECMSNLASNEFYRNEKNA